MTMVTSYHTYESYTYISIEGRPSQINQHSLAHEKSYREVLDGSWREIHILDKHSLGKCWLVHGERYTRQTLLLTVCFEMKVNGYYLNVFTIINGCIFMKLAVVRKHSSNR